MRLKRAFEASGALEHEIQNCRLQNSKYVFGLLIGATRTEILQFLYIVISRGGGYFFKILISPALMLLSKSDLDLSFQKL
jgi:hypothetical protein